MDKNWVIIDVETDGIAAPIHVVEVAAQKMLGWEKMGDIFIRLIDHGIDIPEKASGIHGYTREILERDGLPASEVYDDLRDFVNGMPLVAYNLEFDWDKVLVPEWRRLGIPQIGTRGLCALDLTRRLLDPISAGDFKLQTLRSYYDLPERAAHSADGDVLTLVDLMTQVIYPVAEQRGLFTWDDLVETSEEEWFQSKLPFGKHKGRIFRDAKDDDAFRSWLEWLSQSSNERSCRMGHWYLTHLDDPEPKPVFMSVNVQKESVEVELVESISTTIEIWTDPETERMRALVSRSRDRLAELETDYAALKAKIDQVRARIFTAMASLYEQRDRLRLKIQYRKMYIVVLLSDGEEDAEEVEAVYREADKQKHREYRETAEAFSDKKELTKEEEKRLHKTWKMLVRIYHPDRYHNDPKKRDAYGKLTAEINQAKKKGNIELLEEIAADPEAFMARKGIGSLGIQGKDKAADLRKIWEALQDRILAVLEELDNLKESPDYDLYKMAQKEPAVIDKVISEREQQLNQTIEELKEEVNRLDAEIEELTE